MIHKSEEEWKKELSEEEFIVTRKKGTERAFTGKYWNHHEEGTYNCVCCGTELFTSQEKYESGCGWPSFFDSPNPQNISMAPDNSHWMQRTEILCSQCNAHLGHIFDDGPKPSGQRYCVNSASLTFTHQIKK